MNMNTFNRRDALKALAASGALSATSLTNLSFGAQNPAVAPARVLAH